MIEDKIISSRTLRRALILTCICLALAGLHCCQSSDRAQADKSTFTILYGGVEWVLGPSDDDSPKLLVFLPLATFMNSCREGEHIGLAERWEHSLDYRQWTFYLRKDIRWHDGVPVTAHDIEFTINLWKHPDVQWYGGSSVESVSVIDDHTIVFNIKKPGDFLGEMEWDVFYPKHLLEHLDPKQFFEWDFWTHPVGNGPYRYVRHDPETMMELAANPDYYWGKPTIERVVMKGGGGSAINELLSGNVDIASMDSMIAEKIAARDDRFRVYYKLSIGPVRIVWNVRNLLFRDKMIRRALTMAIDRRSLFGLFNLPTDLPITEGPFTWCLYERRQLKAPWPHDPDEAKRILEDTGWRDENGDGIRERNGRPFHFVAIVAPRWEKAAVFVQDQLRRIGVKMEVQMFSWGLMAQRFGAGDFDAAIPRLPNTNQRIGEFSQNGYKNPRVMELMRALNETVELDARHRIYAELSRIWHDEIPGTFLFPRSTCFVAHRRIRGFDGLSMSTNFIGWGRLWIEEEKE